MKFRPPAGDAPLRHGYTVSQVRALSLALVTRQTWYQSVDFDQRLEVAWHAIIEHIYTSDQPPQPRDALRADVLPATTSRMKYLPKAIR